MTNNKEKYRKGFEEWYLIDCDENYIMSQVDEIGEYKDPHEQFAFEAWCAAKQQSDWISVDERLPETKYEIEEFESDGENCFFHGFVSQSIEISDGHNLARGHYRTDGTWCIYDAQHDFQLVDQADITHWKALPEPPTNTQGDV